MPVVQIILAISVTAIAVGTLVFIGAYVRLTNWSRTSMGRHMLWFMIVVLAFSVLGILRYLDLDDFAGVEWVRALVFASGAVVVWQRVYLLWRYQVGTPSNRSSVMTEEDERH